MTVVIRVINGSDRNSYLIVERKEAITWMDK